MPYVTHKQVYRQNLFGGKSATTLCGRLGLLQTPKPVTCKHCIKILGNQQHWRHKSVLQYGAES